MAQARFWENDPVAQPPAAQPAPGLAQAPGLRMVVPPSPNLPTPQNPAVERHTNVETQRGEQQIRQGETGGHNFSDETGLFHQYRTDPRILNYEAILPVYRAAQTAADTTAGDLNIVNAFAKMTDPSTGVREGEAAAVSGSGTPSQQVQGWLNLLAGGGRLPPEQRQQLLAELATRGAAINRLYNAARADYIRQAHRYGFDPDAVVGSHAALPYRREMGLDRPQNDHRGEDLVFWDEGRRPTPPGAAEFQTALTEAIRSGQTADGQPMRSAADIVRYGQAHGFNIDPHQADDALRAFQEGRGISVRQPEYERPATPEGRGGAPTLSLDVGLLGHNLAHLDTEQVAASARGAADTVSVGLSPHVMAAVDTITRGGSYGENLYNEENIDRYDEENHTIARVVGQLSGGLVIPTGAVTEARTAAIAALRSGLTREEAIAAARVAAGRRLALEGGAYSGVHGAASSDGDASDRIAAFTVDGLLGAAAAGATGRFGPGFGRAGPRETRPPLVDPTTERLNQPLESASPAERVGAAAEHGIDLPMGAATDRGGAIIEKGLDVSPVSAGVMNDARRATEAQATAAVDRVADRFGAARTQHEGGSAAQAGARSWIERATVAAREGVQSVVSKAYNAIPISPATDAALTNTRAALDRLTSRFQSNPELAALEQNQQLVHYRDALASGGLSWEDLKALRSEIGSRIGAERFSDSPSRGDLRSLYAALSEDMRATATAQGPRALRAFERANNLNREVETRIEQALVPILGNDSTQHPERALQFIQNIARGSRGNLDQLAAVRASLAKGGHWDEVASSLIRLGGQPADSPGRAFNPQTFLNWYSDMSEPARNLLFGGGARAELRRNLDSFVEVAQRLAGTNALRNTSNTTPGMIGAGAVGSAGTAIWAGLMSPLTAVGSAAGLAGNYGLARLWTNPRFVRWATGYARMAAGAAGARTSPGARALASQRAYLMRVARASPAIADDIAQLDRRLFGGSETDGAQDAQ